MRINLRIANVAKETGALLTSYLQDRGLTINQTRSGNSPTICYGIHQDGGQTLNGNCGGGDKIRRLVQMEEGGVRTVPWFHHGVPSGFKFPALARKICGHGGEDIVPVFQAEEVPWRIAAGWDWFSSYVPLQTEYRVWVWRGVVLDTYEKVMRRPEDFKYVGRNFRNGFDFLKIPEMFITSVEARKAIKALSFDFGAVDMLLGKDGLIYVLEVNTAPGVIRSGAQGTLGKLADRMVNWTEAGCPERGY